MTGLRTILAAVIVGTLSASCGAGDQQVDDAATLERSATEPSGRVTLLAAASLTESFERLGDQVEKEHPGLDVVVSFGPSSSLVEQAIAGAPADVLATADIRTMDAAVSAGVVEGEPAIFARNTLALITPAGNPGKVTGLVDLGRNELRIALCEPQVPCGAATERLLEAAGVTAEPDTLATDVKDATSLVSLGEADVAVVYLTDAAAASDAVETVDVPESADVVNDYPVAVLAGAPNRRAAEVVVEAITGDLGQGILREAGFLGP